MLQSRTALRSTLSAAAALALALAIPVSAASFGDSGDRLHFVMISAGDHGSSMSGSASDYDRARALRTGNEPILYFREGGAAYVIRDAETLRRADTIFEPQRAMGKRQAALGRQQAELGRRQGLMGAEQGRMAAAHVRAALRDGRTPRDSEALARQQAELARNQSSLGEQQAALGRQQAELGREQARLGKIADANLRALVSEARRRGLAQRVD